jgi:D-alanine transaminase
MIVNLNHTLMPAEQARISPFDRGFTLGDGVYEAMRLHAGRIVGLRRHIGRLTRSLSEARIRGIDPGFLAAATHELVAANGLTDAFVYWQISRGTPPAGAPVRTRIPVAGTVPTVFGYAEPCPRLTPSSPIRTLTATTRPDTRWDRGHIKATSLLGGVLAAIEADEQGGEDAILVRDGLVTEGPSNNLFLVLDGQIVTPALESAPMLAGVTRSLLLDAEPGIVERAVHAHELAKAEEILITGTRTGVAAIARLDGRPVGDGNAPGPAARRLLAALVRAIEADLASADATAESAGQATAAAGQ